MIEGYTLKDWKTLPVNERAALFREELWELGEGNLADPEDRRLLDRVNQLTIDIYTGRLPDQEREIAQAEVKGIRETMLASPNLEAGRVIFEYGWIAALFFGKEITTGIPTYNPRVNTQRPYTAFRVQKTFGPKNKIGAVLIPFR